jgi:cytochrome c-type biogenesis protein CcmH/NrfF
MRFAQVALVAVVAVMTMGAGDNNKRFEKLGHQIMCTCGCNQVLLECNHVGCQSSGEMRDELTAALAGGSIAGGIDGTGGPSGPGGGGPGGGGNDSAPKDGSSGGGSNSDNAILNAFVQKYGPTVLAAPTATGFNIVAWVTPFAVLLLGMAGTVALVRKWRLRTVAMPDVPSTPGFTAMRDRVRRETDL